MAVEVPSGAVVVLGGARVGVPGQDLGIAEGDTGVKDVGDGRVTQRVGTDVAWDSAAVAIRTTIR